MTIPSKTVCDNELASIVNLLSTKKVPINAEQQATRDKTSSCTSSEAKSAGPIFPIHNSPILCKKRRMNSKKFFPKYGLIIESTPWEGSAEHADRVLGCRAAQTIPFQVRA